jgi:hypothetical protein
MYNVMGNKQWIEDSVMGRWLKAGNQERLKRSSKHDYYDYYVDDVAERELSEPHRKDADFGRLSPVDVTDVYGSVYPAKSRMLARRVFFQPSPEVLRYFYLHHDDLPLTLAEIIAKWKITLKGKTLSAANDTLWLLHANYPAKYDQWAGSYIDFYVNANKGFLVEKAFLYESNSCNIDGKTVGRCHSIEVKEYQALGGGIFFPQRTEYRNQVGVERVEQVSPDKCDRSTWTVTKLTLNAPLASDAFDFRFPAGVTVYKHDKIRSDECKVYIWGADNKPAQEFATEREYMRKWAEPRELEKQRKQTEKKRASNNPKDIEEQCIYYMAAKKYDEAIASLSGLIAAHPEPSLTMQALGRRGFIFLIYRSNSAKAADDFTEAIRLAKNDAKDGDKIASGYKVFRALAYAQQDETLDNALADLANVRPPANDLEDWAHDHGDERLACLLRAAIRIHQGKMKSNDVITAQIYQDIAGGYLIQFPPGGTPFPDGYAMLGYVMEKSGDPKNAAVAREMMKTAAQAREEWKNEPPRDVDDDSLALIDAYHRCLVRLVPEIEKAPKPRQ